VDSQYKKSKKHYFKTVMRIPALHVDTEEKLRDRIRLLIILS
jgi:hypothetical protein